MTNIDSLAEALFGSKRAETQEVLTDATTRTYIGIALTDSVDGTVMVDLGGDVTLPDDIEGVSEHSAEGVEVATGPGVRAGDEVVVTLVGGTPLKTPMVTGVAGEGDGQDARIATASAAAEAAWDWADEAHDAATDAQESADEAQDAAESAASAASAAVISAASAEASAQQAISDAAAASTAAASAEASAQQAISDAGAARAAAAAAQADATAASQAANEAKGAATRANTAANDALTQLATVEDVIGVVDWVTEHGTYSLTTDTAIDPDKVYYTRTGSGTQADPYVYTAVAEPDVSDIGSYYELDIDEALSQYVASHLALTNAGLYVLKDSSGYKLLLANDGMRVIDPAGHTVATYGESITFDSERPQRIGGTDSYIEWRDTDSDGVPDSLAIVADSIELIGGQSVSTGSGNVWANHSSATSASGISSWSDTFVAPTTAKPYVWMKSYSIIDGQRVYGNPACITGAKGADGTSVLVTSIEYATSTTESQPSSGWTTTAPSTVAEGSWLWTRVNYSDGSAAVSRAKQGVSGTSGSSSYTHVRYSAQSDGTGFVTTPTASTIYVGIAVTSSSSAPTAKGSYTWSRYVGQQGAQGPQGETGDTGVGIQSYVQMWAKSTSSSVAPTSGWSASRPTSIGTNEHLWVRIDTTWTDNTTTQGTPVVDQNTTDLWHTSAALRVDVDSIDSDVSALQTTVSGHTTTIQQHTTSISQNTDAIALRATKTEVQQVRPAYATSSTAAGTAAKVATIDPAVTGYALYKGATVSVTFSTANTAATPTLNVNSTGAKQIRSYTGAALSEGEYKWAAGATIDLVYDGTYWRMQDGGSVKRVTAAEASIRVNADNIESKVSKDGVISSINQSAETVKIQASKVEIDGTAIFTAISSDVDDAITDKGYATTTQAQGYATTAKSEAISAAATDATTKANAAETNAKNDTTSRLNAMGADNKVVNGAFVNGADNWSAWGSPTTRNRVQVNGKWWMHCVTTATAYQGYQQNHYTSLGVTVEPSTTYTVGITARGAAANTKVCVGFHWFAPSGTSIVSQSWLAFTVGTTAARQYQTVTVPSGIDHFNVMVGQNAATAQEFWITDVTLVKGAVNQEWSESSALAGQASITANAAAPKANAVKRTQRIWYRKSASGAPSTPGTASSNWVTKADDGNDAWTKMHIAISGTHKYIYTCEQYEMANGTVGYTSVLLDNTITVIDGGNIITGTVTANKLNAADINASNSLTIGALTSETQASIRGGGKNLLGNTGNPSNTTIGLNSAAASTFGTIGNYNDAQSLYGFEDYDGHTNAVVWTSTSTGNRGVSYYTKAGEIESGESYTFSCFVKSSVATTVHTHTAWRNGSATAGYTGWSIEGSTSIEADTWTYYSYTFTPLTIANLDWEFLVALCFTGVSTGATFRVAHAKLERGNVATDWTPAPEDMATAESLAGTNESLDGAIADIGELSDQLVGTVSEQNKTITDIQTYLNSLRQDLDAEIQSRQQWLNFNSAEGLVIGAAGSTFKTVTTNTSQQFRSGGTVLAETSGTEFVAPVMRSDQLLIGDWMWARRDNGNLSLKWIG